MRRAQAAKAKRKRITIVAGVAAAVLVVGGGVTALVLNYQSREDVDMSAVQTVEVASSDHVEGTVEYPQTPPVGGNHNQVWLNCGTYADPVPNENAVHAMEHGAVWITYQPTLPADGVDRLKALVRGESYTVLSPYEGLPSPIVASAWGKQLKVTSATDPRLREFLREYVQGPQTPEPGAACVGGTGTPEA